jgi:cobalt-zinc-cadmium efflux system outer membrane protein
VDKPELSVSQTGFGSNQDQELSIGVSQRLDIFGERKSAQRLAQLSKDQSDLNQRIYQAQLELAVKYQWSQLAIFELERNVVQEQLNVSEENLNAFRSAIKRGVSLRLM